MNKYIKGRKTHTAKAPISRTQKKALSSDAIGLALSGGGIRSAAFNLGIPMVRERCGLLKQIDYLSTVSGGGYIGSTLAWLMLKLDQPFSFGTSRRDHARSGEKILSWLRPHGNYLIP